MKILVEVQPKETLHHAFYNMYKAKTERSSYLQQDDEHKIIKVSNDKVDHFQLYYTQFFLYCACYFLQIVNVACRK